MATANSSGMVRWAAVGIGAVVLATVVVAPIATRGTVNSGWELTPGHVARTLAHLVGIVGGLGIVYYAETVRGRTKGSTLGTSMLYVEVGTALFVAVFLGMEAQHLLGVGLWYFADTMAVTQLWYMVALTVVMLLYTAAYRALVVEMGG